MSKKARAKSDRIDAANDLAELLHEWMGQYVEGHRTRDRTNCASGGMARRLMRNKGRPLKIRRLGLTIR